ncbi:putative rhamnosyl transferase [Sinorhizobium numidicum]|uniref:Rhamnosyl transferase n=1 Tax=Sinorhizobium numidicum TaxID=680248 RepID=A0ABY8CUL8_9HYPH|nr:glycosyltransferase [Sinorhizobium numidicum]WEX74940.1 putative rhamnosyl transferase [Sinorhizobium numidicum]WEX80933.1 putative rhamnosyl transferase [Sinorhizobium numidicum]
MSVGLNHILLTRFNLPSRGVESLIRAKDGWLRDRIDLFEQYCLPSVSAQTNQNFNWIVYFDPASPEWLKNWIAGHAKAGLYTPIFRESVSREEMIGDIRGVIEHEGKVLVTTNLDNDDGIASDFVDRVQSVVTPHERVAIYVVNGLIRRADRVYLHRDIRNAFNSVRESWSSPVTSWSAWHTELGEHMPVVEIDGQPGWLQVVHGSNVSNRVKGRLVSPMFFKNRFGRLLDGVHEPRKLDLGRDRLVSLPARFVLESARALAKRVVLRILGREGLGSVKALWRSRLGLWQS